jgi:uncharacterized membrane protein
VGSGTSSEAERLLAPVAPADRMQTVAFLNEAHAAGNLSPADREDRLERVFRAEVVGELDAVVSDLPGAAVLRLQVRGVSRKERRAASWTWQKRLLAWTAGSILLWTMVWFATGGSFLWLAASWLLSLLAFTFRFARRGKKGLGRKARRRGLAGV